MFCVVPMLVGLFVVGGMATGPCDACAHQRAAREAVDRVVATQFDGGRAIEARVEASIAARERAGSIEDRVEAWADEYALSILVGAVTESISDEQWVRFMEASTWLEMEVAHPGEDGEQFGISVTGCYWFATPDSRRFPRDAGQRGDDEDGARARARVLSSSTYRAAYRAEKATLRIFITSEQEPISEMRVGMETTHMTVSGARSRESVGLYWPEGLVLPTGEYIFELTQQTTALAAESMDDDEPREIGRWVHTASARVSVGAGLIDVRTE